MVEAAEAAQSLDLVTLGTNLGIFVGFIVAAILGIKKGIAAFGKGDKALSDNKKHIAGAQLLETATIGAWTESNAEVAELLQELISKLSEVKGAGYQLGDRLSEHKQELGELRHQVERLRDKL